MTAPIIIRSILHSTHAIMKKVILKSIPLRIPLLAILALSLLLSFPLYLAVSTGGGGGGDGGGSGGGGSGGGGGSTYTPTFNESKLSCTQEPTLQERVECRYALAENYSELTFLPEECSTKTGKDRDDCLELYENVQPCWKLESDPARESCLKVMVGLTDLREEKAKCSTTSCLYELRKKGYSLVKLRLYSLEDKAEDLEEFGVSKQAIITVIIALEQAKVAFNEAGSTDERKTVIMQAREAWQAFKALAVQQVKEGKNAS